MVMAAAKESVGAKSREMVSTVEKATLSVQEVAIMLGINVCHAYEMLYQGKLPAQKLGKKWIISRQQITDWLNNAPAIPICQREEAAQREARAWNWKSAGRNSRPAKGAVNGVVQRMV